VRPPRGVFVVVHLRDEAVGCGAVKHHPGRVSDIKRMWIAESARGMGLGRLLLHHLEGLAAEQGSTQVRLETNDVLSEALALYRASGYVEVAPFNDEPYADRWFAKELNRSS
jgi:GNAT superfamily N-acetyltransferase